MNSELASVFNRECILAMPPSVTQRSLVWRSVSSLSEAGKVSNASVPRLVALCLEEPALLMRADGQASLLRVFTVEVNSCAGTIALVPQGAILPTAPSAARVVFVLFCPLERHAEASLITDRLVLLTNDGGFTRLVSSMQRETADQVFGLLHDFDSRYRDISPGHSILATRPL